MAQRKRTARTCVFCGSSGSLTREHVYPQWIWREHGEGRPPAKVIHEGPSRYAEGFTFDADGVTGQTHSPVNNKPVLHATGVIVRSVCRDCNNGWMSSLEVEMASTLRRIKSGKTWRPTVEEIAAFRRWVAKTVILLECAEPEIQLAPTEVFQAVREGTALPGSWYVGLARVGSDDAFDMMASPVHRTLRVGDAPLAQSDGSNRFATGSLIILAGLMIIVRYSPYEVRPPARLDHDLVKHRRGRPVALDPAAAKRPVKFRTLPRMTEDDIDDFAYWGHAVTPSGGMTLLGSGDVRWIGQIATARPEELLFDIDGDYKLRSGDIAGWN